MRVLHFSGGPDIGGQAMAQKAALERLAPEFEVRVIATRSRMGYPQPERFTDLIQVERAYAWADVVVLHNDVDVYRHVDNGRRKPVILHHHGSAFRNDPEGRYAAGEAIGALQVVSTVDLLTFAPKRADLTWLPQVVDTDAMRDLRVQGYIADGRFRIAHAPTNWEKKGTREVIAAVASLARRFPVELVLIDGTPPAGPVPWPECLLRKAACDLLIDQFELGYGGNAVEAWALGMPVIAGATAPIRHRMRRVYGRRDLPFVQTTKAHLEDSITGLLRYPEWYTKLQQRGQEQVRRFHSQAAVVALLRDLYARVPASVGARKAA